MDLLIAGFRWNDTHNFKYRETARTGSHLFSMRGKVPCCINAVVPAQNGTSTNSPRWPAQVSVGKGARHLRPSKRASKHHMAWHGLSSKHLECSTPVHQHLQEARWILSQAFKRSILMQLDFLVLLTFSCCSRLWSMQCECKGGISCIC